MSSSPSCNIESYLPIKVVVPGDERTTVLPTEVLDTWIEVVTPGIVVVLGTCDDVGDMEAVVVTKTYNRKQSTIII